MEYTAIVTEDVFMATKAQDILHRAGVPSQRTSPGVLDRADPPPAVVVLDLGLPEEQCQAVVRWAKGRMPVVAFGPHVDAQALFWARQAGCATVLTKGQLDARLGRAVVDILTTEPSR
jgi:FixJ family two-component response regulator